MINGASFAIGASFAPTGGTATDVKTKTNVEKHIAYLDDGSALIDQKVLEFSSKDPVVNASAPNGYTQARSTVVVKVPLSLDNGNRTINTVKMEIACDIETTDAEKATLREYALHCLSDSDIQEFWDEQSRS